MRRCKQEKWSAYKLSHGSNYGNLKIDADEFFQRYKLISHKDDQILFCCDVDKHFTDLLTKRYNVKRDHGDFAKKSF